MCPFYCQLLEILQFRLDYVSLLISAKMCWLFDNFCLLSDAYEKIDDHSYIGGTGQKLF